MQKFQKYHFMSIDSILNKEILLDKIICLQINMQRTPEAFDAILCGFINTIYLIKFINLCF